jgi:small-conductance mechanosensitive channel
MELLGFLVIIYFLIAPGLSFVGAGQFTGSLERTVLSAAALCVAFLLNGVVGVVLWDGLLSDHGQRKVPVIVTEGVGLTLYLIVILLVMHFVYDEPIGGLLATSGVAALVFGFAAQSTLKEVFSGVALNATQALRIGDYVEIDGIYGQVYQINWRSISIRNPHTDSLYIWPIQVFRACHRRTIRPAGTRYPRHRGGARTLEVRASRPEAGFQYAGIHQGGCRNTYSLFFRR